MPTENLLLEFSLIECTYCNTHINEATAIAFESENYCEVCYNRLFDKCVECNEVFYKNDLTNIDGSLVCENCRDENYAYCEHCGNYVSNDEIREAYNHRHNSIIICNDCYDNDFFTCDNCNDVYRDSENNNDLCRTCFAERYYHCDSCGCDVSINDVYYDEESGNEYCRDCFDTNNLKRKNSHIHGYTYKPNAKFFKVGNENTFFGIELEVDTDNSSNNDITEDIQHDSLYFKEDGSLDNGFEIVTHPLSYEYIKENKAIFEERLKTLKSNGYKSYNTETCGMHIHISKKSFNTWHLYRFLKFFKENKQFIVAISQRKIEHLEHWSNIDDYEFNELNLVYKAKNKTTCSSRYLAVNLNNSNTVEIRIFRGTLKITSFLKNIEFVASLVEFTKQTNTENISLSNYKNWLHKTNEYKNLTTFIQTEKL